MNGWPIAFAPVVRCQILLVLWKKLHCGSRKVKEGTRARGPKSPSMTYLFLTRLYLSRLLPPYFAMI